jgi:DNA-directed RNA polymerase subunit RPC12/RpoP
MWLVRVPKTTPSNSQELSKMLETCRKFNISPNVVASIQQGARCAKCGKNSLSTSEQFYQDNDASHVTQYCESCGEKLLGKSPVVDPNKQSYQFVTYNTALNATEIVRADMYPEEIKAFAKYCDLYLYPNRESKDIFKEDIYRFVQAYENDGDFRKLYG